MSSQGDISSEADRADPTVFLGLGSNLGDRWGHLERATDRLCEARQIRDLVVSPVYETEAHTRESGAAAPPYLNAVARFSTRWTPVQLLSYCQLIEREAGRRREDEDEWAPRTLDLDLLIFGRITGHTPRLDLPHPRLAERRFVLEPLVDLNPDLRVPPPFEAPVRTLLDRCSDDADVRRLSGRLRVPRCATSNPTG